MRKAVYAGSFDPITNGHLWMIEQGVRLFDELVVAIGSNPDKKYTFSREERRAMLDSAVRHLPPMIIDMFDHQFLVHYADAVGAQYILRGIRNEGDFSYERGMRNINSDLHPDIVTVYLIPPREIAEVSSSLVKGLIGPQGWRAVVARYVPEAAYQLLLDRFGRQPD